MTVTETDQNLMTWGSVDVNVAEKIMNDFTNRKISNGGKCSKYISILKAFSVIGEYKNQQYLFDTVLPKVIIGVRKQVCTFSHVAHRTRYVRQVDLRAAFPVAL